MTVIAVSNILLWVVVVGLSFTVFALIRQIGLLHERVSPAGALSIDKASLRTGEAAPVFKVTTLDGRATSIGGERDDGKATLLFFLSDTCPVCKVLLPVLKSMQAEESSKLSIVLASDGDVSSHEKFVRAAGLEGFDYVLSEPLGRGYEVGKLPYGVLIDEQGTLVTHGLVNNREHLESLLEARNLGVANAQEFAAKSAA